MLYVNVYHVTQLYGGPEEGGWYYDAGEPIASIPIPTKESHQDYWCSTKTEGIGRKGKVTQVSIHLRECSDCKGSGRVEQESEDLNDKGEPYVYDVRCPSCGEIPNDLEATGKLMVDMYAMFDGTTGRYEHIAVMLQSHYAAPFPERRPHYE